jgi:hypothetical protein
MSLSHDAYTSSPIMDAKQKKARYKMNDRTVYGKYSMLNYILLLNCLAGQCLFVQKCAVSLETN